MVRTPPGCQGAIRHPTLPGVLVQVLLCWLVLLATCGTVPPPSDPPASLPRREPSMTPAAASVDPAPSGTLSKIIVVLDPGHNGGNAGHPAEINRQVPTGRGGTKACDTTGTATNAGYPEHAFAWDVALRVRDALTARGVQVILTRPDDAGVGPCVNDRAAIANRAGARAKVSIHADGAAPSGHGFHVAYADPPVHPSQGSPSIALATALVRALRTGGFPAANYIGSGGRYPRSDLAGLNLSQIPAVLVECANMRNPQEAALVSTPAGRARYAAAITEGIMAWLTSP